MGKNRFGEDSWIKFEQSSRKNGHCLKCKQPRVPGYSKCEKHLELHRLYSLKYYRAHVLKQARIRRTQGD